MKVRSGFERIVACDGIVNFRDYGGYSVRGGGRLRTGLLFRSAQHATATADDLARVASLNFEVVFDLRGVQEREHAPCARPIGFAAEVIRSTGDTSGSLAPHLAAALGVSDAATARQAMLTVYRGMIGRPVLQDMLRRYFERLARAPSNSLVHCHSGKDRTGIAVALLHRVLGVHEDDLMEDYLLTNRAARIEERMATTELRKRYPGLTEDAVRLLLGVEPAFLIAAFDEMMKMSGSVEGYMTDVLGVDAARIESLRHYLVL